jgi:hypothetical protein
MKPVNTVATIMLVATLYFSCSGNSSDTRNTRGIGDTTTTSASDSTMSAHHRDPSTAFPQPPVSGSQVDSSHVKDSMQDSNNIK